MICKASTSHLMMRSMAAMGGEQRDLGGLATWSKFKGFLTLKAASSLIIVPIDQVSNSIAGIRAAADHAGKSLESWLRDKFFIQHCKLFHHRPFMTVSAVRKNGASVLRDKPNIKWTKDWGKDVPSAPWYHLGPEYGGNAGDRINEHHLSLAEKQATRNK